MLSLGDINQGNINTEKLQLPFLRSANGPECSAARGRVVSKVADELRLFFSAHLSNFDEET